MMTHPITHKSIYILVLWIHSQFGATQLTQVETYSKTVCEARGEEFLLDMIKRTGSDTEFNYACIRANGEQND